MASSPSPSVSTYPRFRSTLRQHGPWDLYSGYEGDSEDEGCDLDDVYLGEEEEGEDAEWKADLLPFRQAGHQRNLAMMIPAAVNGMHDKLPVLPKKELLFDDRDMVDVPSEDEVDSTRTFVVPFGPRVQVNHENYTYERLRPRTARAIAIARNLPGVRQVEDATIAVTSASMVLQANAKETYDDVSKRLAGPARLGREVGICTAQIGGYLAGEAWTAAKNVSVAVREDFTEAVQPLRDGTEIVGEVLAEGMRALPREGVIGRYRQRRI
ncbi:hypothetical protein B0J13DRAFT_642205 [Dactylonectria estremocensis]|uniref:Uncharacterized protein n=1 Tax=Dactylonectria estremocensis TaxID=1079267 RepID=A0A9P9E6E3_9HYPO|nr:hypothetical protein B0J13DRAFT_642205 [Dactylonectria estremocensis]